MKFEIGKYYRVQLYNPALDLIYKITNITQITCTYTVIICLTGYDLGDVFAIDSIFANNSMEFDKKYLKSIKLLYEK